jgi:hypothetical protein
LHITEGGATKFLKGVQNSTTNADAKEVAAGVQQPTKSYGSHVGQLIGQLKQTKSLAGTASKMSNAWSPDKWKRENESTWRLNGAAARSILGNLPMFDDIMQVRVVDNVFCAVRHNALQAVPPPAHLRRQQLGYGPMGGRDVGAVASHGYDEDSDGSHNYRGADRDTFGRRRKPFHSAWKVQRWSAPVEIPWHQ